MGKYLKKYIDLDGMSKAKVDKLIHYCNRDPKILIQYDGFTNAEADDVMHPDTDGDCIMEGGTVELMWSSSVRVLIEPDTPEDVIIRVLHKIINWIKEDSHAMKIAKEMIGSLILDKMDSEPEKRIPF